MHVNFDSVAVFSFGKTLHATGWKMGYVVGPEYLVNEFKAVHQWNVFCTNSFVQFAIADYLEKPDNYEYLPSFFQKKRDRQQVRACVVVSGLQTICMCYRG